MLAGAQRRALDGDTAAASRFLAERCARLNAPASCLRERVTYALQGDPTAQDDAITAYLAAACDSPAGCAKAALWVGDRLRDRGDQLGALVYYSRAVKESPTRAAWQKLASASKAAGQLQRSQEAQRRASDVSDDAP
jgi:tetratricopeptide (TPR) repeat protein